MADAKTFADIVDESRRKNAEKSPWISVTERLPETWKRVLVLHENGFVEIEYLRKDNGEFLYEYIFGKVTHWMPLPPAPKEEETK